MGRSLGSAAGPIRFGAFEFDRRTLELRKNGLKIRIEGQPARVLSLLVARAGDLVTREELQQALWKQDTFVSFEQGINSCIRRLREVLGDSAQSPHFIETLPRRGYRFVYPLQAEDEVTRASAESQRTPMVALAVLAVTVTSAAILIFLLSPQPALVASARLFSTESVVALRSRALESRQRPEQKLEPELDKIFVAADYYRLKRTRENLERAIDLYRQVLDSDPTYAPAWARIGECYELLGQSYDIAPSDALPKARAALEQALRLDPSLAEAHKSLGLIRAYVYDWDGAEEEAAIARSLDPTAPGDSYTLTLRGKFEEAIKVAKEAAQDNPLSARARHILAWTYFQAGRYDDSIEELKKAIEIDRRYRYSYIILGWDYVKKGMCSEAIAACEKGRAIEQDQADLSRGRLEFNCGWEYASCGRRREALLALQENERVSQKKWIDPATSAFLYDALGDHDRAVELMWKSYEAGFPVPQYYVCRMCTDALRAHPKYQALRRLIGPPESRTTAALQPHQPLASRSPADPSGLEKAHR